MNRATVRNTTIAVGVLAAAALFATACSDRREGDAPPVAAGATSPEATPRRIVAFTCGAVDILTMLGELSRVIAVEEDCPAPGTEALLKIRNDDHPGQVQVPQVEAILALQPDLVIAKPTLKEAFGSSGLRMLWSPPIIDLESLPGFVEEIAAALGASERARALLEHMSGVEQELRETSAALPKVRVYYESNGLGQTAGRASIIDAMIRLAGGANIAGDAPQPNVAISAEVLFGSDPEVILLGPWAPPTEEVLARPGWSRISAVRNGRVHRITEEYRYVTLGTPRCVDGARDLLLPWIHPELGLGSR